MMKKITQTLFVIVFSLILFSCGKEDINPVEKPNSNLLLENQSVDDVDMTAYVEDGLDMKAYAEDDVDMTVNPQIEEDTKGGTALKTTTLMALHGFVGQANDIGVGADNSVWCVGYGSGDRAVYYKGYNSYWTKIPGYGRRIAVGPDGIPWLVSTAGTIYKWTGSLWQKYPGQANDIGVGADGSVWIIGYGSGNRSVYKWTNNSYWQKYPGAGTRIDVRSNGKPCIVTEVGTIWAWTGSSFVKLGTASGYDIGIKEPWTDHLGDYNPEDLYMVSVQLFKWNGSDFVYDDHNSRCLINISCGPYSYWVTDNTGYIWSSGVSTR